MKLFGHILGLLRNCFVSCLKFLIFINWARTALMASVINNAFSAFSSYTFRTFRIVSIWNRKLESEKLQNLKLANTFASHHSLHIFCLLFRCASWHRNFQLKFKNPKMQQEHKFFRLVFSVLAKRPSKRNEQKSQTKINE